MPILTKKPAEGIHFSQDGRMNHSGQFRQGMVGSRMPQLAAQRALGSIDYYLGQHSVFYPLGGPMNGQTARLEIVRTLIVALRPALLVEIGTFRGATTEWLAQFGPPVVSLEASPRYHRFCELRLGARANVHLIPGQSVAALHRLATAGAFADGPVLFYVNNRTGSHALLLEQLKFIFSNCASCLVVVDDFQVEGDRDYTFSQADPAEALTTDALAACELPSLAVFFPAVPGRRETGARRGAAFLTTSPDVARLLEATPALRAWRVPKDADRADPWFEGPSNRAGTNPKPRLDDITLCCADCAQPELAMRALRISRAHCDFAATVLFTNADITQDGVEIRHIPRIGDRTAYSRFVLQELAAHVATPFVLVVQWDGYVLDAACWEDGFRQFDYIGAPWSYRGMAKTVGNGGFSLRSSRLLQAVKDLAIPPGPQAEDDLICNVWRAKLEQSGIRFADLATARRFSVEMERTEAPSFGFHGLHNFWRAVPAAELASVLDGMTGVSSWLAVLILEYARRRRWTEANLALTAYERQLGTAKTIQALSDLSPDVGAVVYDAIRRLDAREHADAGGNRPGHGRLLPHREG